jgi:hypothetical protein
MGTKEDETSTGHIWAAVFHHGTARSCLARVLKLMNCNFFNFHFYSDRSKPQTIETADTESVDTGARMYLNIYAI